MTHLNTSLLCAALSVALLLSLAMSLDAAAQTVASSDAKESHPATQHPVQRLNMPKDFEQFGVYWTEEPGWHTDLQLRNNLAAQELVVAPALRSVDGTESKLAPVTIQPGDVVTVPLHEAVMKAPPELASPYGSVVLRYRAPVGGALQSTAMIHLDGRPIAFHVDAYGQPEGLVAGSREGIWWLPRETATDYLVLTDTGDKPLDANLILRDSSGRSARQKLTLAARQTTRLSVRSLLAKSHLGGFYGGITVEVAKGAAYLDTLHVIFDEVAGSSAVMKMFDQDPRVTIQERAWGGLKDWTIRAPMLALTHPDPALGFPRDTTLQPQVFVRNTTPQPQTAQLHFNWRSATSSGRTRGISLSLKPYQTQLVDVAALQTQKLLPPEAQWASVFIGIPGVQPDQILAVATSYDKTGRYGAQTPFSDQLSAHWEGDKWQVDDTHNSIITVGNGGSKAARAKLTLLYNHGQDRYEIEQLLASEEQMWIDVGQLARTQTPDKKGHVLPPGDASGAYRLEEVRNTGIGNLFEGKLTVDKTYGEAVYGCMTCCNPGLGYMLFNPLGVPVSGDAFQGVWGIDACTGNQVDMTGWYSTWGTGNTAIATATMNHIHGVAAGSTNNHAWGAISWGTGQEQRHCPIRDDTPSGGTDVQPTVTISGPTNIPMLKAGAQGSDSITVTATGNPTGGTYSWTAVSGGSNITILNATSQNAILQSVAVGTYTVEVTYTVNNQNGTATTVGRVQQPGSLGVISNATPTFNCGNTGLPAYNTADRLIQYQVLDTSGSPIPAAGMDASETTLNVISNTCNVAGPNPTINSPTLSDGYFQGPDSLQLCSAQCLPAGQNGVPLGSCTMKVAQTWGVNGYSVKSDTLTYTCPGPPTGAP
jgi:hypothetical protein